MRLHAGPPKIFWEDSVTTAAYLINREPSVPLGFRIPEEEWQGKEVSLTHLKVFGCDSYVKGHKVIRSRDVTFNEDPLYGANAATDSSNLTKPIQKDQIVLEDSLDNLANKSIVAEHGLSSKINQRVQVEAHIQMRGTKTVGASRIVEDQMKKTLKKKHPPRRKALRLYSFMKRAGYKRCAMDHCCYLKKVGLSSIILLLYIDDMLVAGSDMAEIKKLKRQLSQKFKIKDLGSAKQILGMSVIRDKTNEARCQSFGDHFKLGKKQAPKTEASRRRMAKVLYALAVGSVMYAREAVKWLLRYLKGTSNATLCFLRKEVVLVGFSDSDYRGCLDSGKSTTGYVFTVGGTSVSWMSRIHKLSNFLKELDIAQTECVLFCDNQSDIHLAKNSLFHGRTKHIKIRYHYIRELVSEGTLSLKKILRAKNPADMLTKVVTTEKLKLCTASTDLRDN
ncbi:retrovirus-related pol polyprotein from transposon TNT 1-94 [Tanacetum coccineum]